MIGRQYNKETDKESVQRIWLECGWIEEDNKDQKEGMVDFLACGNARVYEVNNSAECLISSHPGQFYHGSNKLSHLAITSVTCSRIVRKQGIAKRLLAETIALEAEKGYITSGLGMFEQGFYNLLGYGTTWYEHILSFDPAWLKVPRKAGVPVRLSKEDAAKVYENHTSRKKGHGTVILSPEEFIFSEMKMSKNSFGLGYMKDGKLSHHFWCHAEGEHGPDHVHWLCYQNLDQLLELLALLHSISDQVRKVTIQEPPFIQLQDFIRKPFQLKNIAGQGKFQSNNRAIAYHQIRILDLPKAVECISVAETLECNLILKDPIEELLPEEASWRGCGGEYTLRLGPSSEVSPGLTEGLDTMEIDISSFSRMWAGVVTPEAIVAVGNLQADQGLLEKLAAAFPYRKGSPDWGY